MNPGDTLHEDLSGDVIFDDADTPRAVLTGSTNWTWTGVAGQNNNLTVIEQDEVAGAFSRYWDCLRADKQPVPNPLTSKVKGANQSDNLKERHRSHDLIKLEGGASVELWCAPNVPGRAQEPKPETAPPPPDFDRLFSLMRRAQRAILFLVFYPSTGGRRSTVE